MKKTLIVANSSGLITLFLKNDVEILIEKGYSIECACNTNYPDTNTDEFFRKYNIKVHQVDFPIRNLDIKLIISSYKKLNEILKKGDYDLICCHSTIVAALARECVKRYRKHGVKVIYTSHGFPFYEGSSGKMVTVYKLIEYHYSKYTDAIITICNEDLENARKMKCKYVNKINGVGIELNRFEIKDFSKEEYLKKLNLPLNQKIVLSVGEINTNKNHEVVVRALQYIKDLHITYVICGREVTEKGKKDFLLSLANELGVDLRFLGFRSDIPQVCKCADIGVISSFKEGLGLSGIEMLAAGIPVVGSRRQGIKDYVIDGETGYLCDPNSPESFARGIKAALLLKNKIEIRKKCIDKSKEFSVENARNKINNIYEEILVK